MLLWSAAALSAIWAVVHIVWGGRDVAAPLRAQDGLDPVVRETMMMVWHFVSASLTMMAVGFALSALGFGIGWAGASTAVAACYFMIGAGLQIGRGLSFSLLPQGWLFLPVAALGVGGLI